MATPTLRTVREGFPQARITGVMSPVIQQLLSSTKSQSGLWLDDVVTYHKRAGRSQAAQGTVSRWALVGEFRRRKLDVLLLLTNSWWSAAVAWVAGVKSVVGYDRDVRGWMLSDPIDVPTASGRRQAISAVDYYLELSKWIGCNPLSREMQLSVDEEDQCLGDRLWAQIGFDTRRPTVVINANAAQASSRVWPADKVRELCLRLADEQNLQVLLHCGPGEREAANSIAAEANCRNIASMGMASNLPLGLSRAVLARAAVVVSSDSGARHMAVALGRPVVTLFGPTEMAWTTTYNTPELAISEAVDCRPCYQSQCPLKHHRCMQDIGVQRVLDAVMQQMSVNERQRPRVLSVA